MNIHLDFSAREWTIRDPLAAVNATVTDDRSAADVVITDNPRNARLLNAPTYYRPRGNWWRVMARRPLGTYRRALTTLTRFPFLDGILVPGGHLARVAARHAPNADLDLVPLSIDVGEWPTVTHTDAELRCVTLTNFDYKPKVAPLVEYAFTVSQALDTHGGTWRICGDGEYREWVYNRIAGYPNIDLPRYVDATEALAESSLMLHLSGMDISAPNAVLEGAASNLPVVVNGFEGFDSNMSVVQTEGDRELEAALERFTEPRERARQGGWARGYVADRHDPERVGWRIMEAIEP